MNDLDVCVQCGTLLSPGADACEACGAPRATLTVDPQDHFWGPQGDPSPESSPPGGAPRLEPPARPPLAVGVREAPVLPATFDSPPAHPGLRRLLGWPLVSAALVVGGLVWALRDKRGPEVPTPVPAPAAAPTPARPAVPAVPAVTDEDAVRLLALARPSLATVECGTRVRNGFFVTEDLLVTDLRNLCEDAAPLVRMPDDRTLFGKTAGIDQARGLALLEVLGAGAKPLPLGEAGGLAPATRTVALGLYKGLFRGQTMRLGPVDRNVRGTGFVLLDRILTHDDLGGPLLDLEGRVVGVVTTAEADGYGNGLALPIDYLHSAPLALLPDLKPPSPSAGWERYLARIATLEAEDQRRAARAFQHPEAYYVTLSDPQVGLLLRSPEPPPPTTLSLLLRLGTRTLCQQVTNVSDWKQAIAIYRPPIPTTPQLDWLRANDLASDLWVAQVPLRPDCFSRRVQPGLELVVESDGDTTVFPLEGAPQPR